MVAWVYDNNWSAAGLADLAFLDTHSIMIAERPIARVTGE
jgi:hypothetical protein